MSRNQVRISGFLGQDAKPITTEKSQFTSLNLAIPRYKKDHTTGQWEELKPEWIEVMAFDGVAEKRANFLKKGDRVEIDGFLKTITRDVDGKSIPFTKVIAKKIEKLAKIEDPAFSDIPNFYSDELPQF